MFPLMLDLLSLTFISLTFVLDLLYLTFDFWPFHADLPGSPTDVKVTAYSEESVTLAWVAPTDDGDSPVSHYQVEYKEKRATKWEVSYNPVHCNPVES